jgi:hypothetical protein
VLDAACETGKYFGMVQASHRSLLGVDHMQAYLDNAGREFPHVSTKKHEQQDLPYHDQFDGVMCLDAMEFTPRKTGLWSWDSATVRYAREGGCT